MVARLNPDGKYDFTFGGGDGRVIQDLGGYEFTTDVATDGQDRILVTGTTQLASQNIRGFVARFNPDGQLDASLGGIGWIEPFNPSSATTGVSGVTVDSQQRIVISGNPGYEAMAAARLLDDGSKDPSFGTGSISIANFDPDPEVNEYSSTIAVDKKGLIHVVGVVQGDIGGGGGRASDANDIAVARFRADGNLDKTYSDNGMTQLGIAGGSVGGGPAIVDRAGRVVTVSTIRNGNTFRGASVSTITTLINRFRADGSPDTSFGQGGHIEVLRAGKRLLYRGITADNKGRYLFTGIEADDVNSTSNLVIARYNVGYPTNPPSVNYKCGGVKATIFGNARANKLKGTRKRDVIVGLGGNDVIRGLGGNDLICGGKGNDKLIGGPGKDKLIGGAGRDKLIGGPGRDRIIGGKGRDRCPIGPGNDRLSGCERG